MCSHHSVVCSCSKKDNGVLGEVTSPLGPWKTTPRAHVQLWDPHQRSRHTGPGRLTKLMEHRTFRAWGNGSGQPWHQKDEGMAPAWHLQPPSSQAQRHWARPFGEEHRDRTTHCSSNRQAGRQEIARYKSKVIYSEVAQTLEQVPREAVQSPFLEIQKAHLAKRPMNMWTLARGGIRDLQGPFLLTFL